MDKRRYLSAEEAAKVRQLKADHNLPNKAIAERFNVSPGVVRVILQGEHHTERTGK